LVGKSDGAELVLEPNSDAPALAAQKTLYDAHSRQRRSPPVISTATSTGSPDAA
jgi:hypothetical protein